MTGYIILGFIIGTCIGYLVFYFRYQHKDTVNELRSNLKEANKELQHINTEIDEYEQQNIILKEKVSELLEKNDDLSQVTSELSKYYYHMKKASEKTKELIRFLQSPDSSIEEKMHKYIGIEDSSYDDEPRDKQFF
jgi:uncharacterized membrane-anchored protein YhcB (DUF1043 family)